MSRPAVKALGPAPVKRMARTVGEEERVWKTSRISSHMLDWRVSAAGFLEVCIVQSGILRFVEGV